MSDAAKDSMVEVSDVGGAPATPLDRVFLDHKIRVLREYQVFLAMSLQFLVTLAALALLGSGLYKQTADITALGAAAANIVATVGFHAWKCRAQNDAPSPTAG